MATHKHAAISIALIVSLILVGCAGRSASPVRSYKATDDGLSCPEIKSEMSYVDNQVATLIPESHKGTKNAVLGVTGWFLIVPWFFMDLSKAEQQEIKAYQNRYMELEKLYAKKGCTSDSGAAQVNQQQENNMNSVVGRLEALSTLKESGLISEEEYNLKRKEIIADM